MMTDGCERVDLPVEPSVPGSVTPSDEDSSGENSEPILGTGQGSGTHPYTVSEILSSGTSLTGREVWAVGYVVGWAYKSMEYAEFTAEGAKETNVLMADDPEEYDADFCMPVRLTSAKWKRGVGLVQNPDSLGRCIRVLGLVGTYLKTTGITDLADYQWLGDGIPFHTGGDDEEDPPPGPGTGEEPPDSGDDTPDGPQKDTLSVEENGGGLNGGRIIGRQRKVKARRAAL